MDTNILLEKLRIELARGETDRLYSLSAADAKGLLSKINSLESALADLLRSVYAKTPQGPAENMAV